MATKITIPAAELKAGDTVEGASLGQVRIGRKYVTLRDHCGMLLGTVPLAQAVEVVR